MVGEAILSYLLRIMYCVVHSMFCYKYMIKRENYLIVADVTDAKTQDKNLTHKMVLLI